MKPRKDTVRKLYRQAILEIFGLGDDPDFADDNLYLKEAVHRDVHYSSEAPGQWAPNSTLEIYCENGIPNATDVFDPSWHGLPGNTIYNSEKWQLVDEWVNLYLQASGTQFRYHHEPHNGAVVNIWETKVA